MEVDVAGKIIYFNLFLWAMASMAMLNNKSNLVGGLEGKPLVCDAEIFLICDADAFPQL